MLPVVHLPDGTPVRQVTADGTIRIVFGAKPSQKPLPIRASFPVYIPHTKRHPQVIASSPANSTWVDVTASPLAYMGALLHWWTVGETFMVLEHDVICRADVIGALTGCPEPWCLYPYEPGCPCGNPDCRESGRNNLGCTRFRTELIQAVPDAVSSIPRELWGWQRVCDGLGNQLRAAGFTHHWHEPGVAHIPKDDAWRATP